MRPQFEEVMSMHCVGDGFAEKDRCRMNVGKLRKGEALGTIETNMMLGRTDMDGSPGDRAIYDPNIASDGVA